MYISTRGNYAAVTAAEVIKLGMVPGGGLFVPQNIPILRMAELKKWGSKTYPELAARILTPFLGDYSPREINDCLAKAYGSDFSHPKIAPIIPLQDNLHILELWHGPTAAFKDMALQLMPHLLSLALEKHQVEQEVVILVATSGDTGKAALEGFKDVPGLRIICFYPHQGVSVIQEKQMLTTAGKNTAVVAVQGNFDDCQNAVKGIFADRDFNAFLAEKGLLLSSANSINWGRLVPQIVYYFDAYLNLAAQGHIHDGEKINIVVPTGNFGNILAAWYAGQMGLPLHRLLCASNENNVLTDFFNTGVYEKNRPLRQTQSPSMDILVSSNLERFLFEMTNRDSVSLRLWMKELQEKGRFAVGQKMQQKIGEIIWAGFATEGETRATIKEIYDQKGYLLDPHTAVGMRVYQQYLSAGGDRQTVTVLVSTANPFKFAAGVLAAVHDSVVAAPENDGAVLAELSKVSGWSIHPALRDLGERKIRQPSLCVPGQIKEEIVNILGLSR